MFTFKAPLQLHDPTKVVDGIQDIRDESNREGMQIVLELSRDANPDLVSGAFPNNLFLSSCE